jgi:hypothetical protein
MVTKISVGLFSKLNALVMMNPSGLTTNPVVGPVPFRTPGAGGAPGGPFLPTTSAPPAVSILTTIGATFADAAFIAASVASMTSAARTAIEANGIAKIAAKNGTYRENEVIGWVPHKVTAGKTKD